MLITVQHPVCDYRLFFKQSYKISKPYFTSPDPDEFIRYFGAMKSRFVYRDFYCRGENNYCAANHALKIIREKENRPPVPIRLKNDESRFYSDGNILCKFENKASYTICNEIADAQSFIPQTLQYHLNQKTGVNDMQGGLHYTTLAKAGKQLASLYLKASSKYAFLDNINTFWTGKGLPVCMIELFENEISANGLYDCCAGLEAVPGMWDEYLKLYYFNYQNIPCWVIHRETNVPEAFKLCLNLRTALLRIHAEKQVLINSLKFLSVNKDNDGIEKEKVVSYLKKTLNKLLKGERFDIEQCPIVDAAFKIDDSRSQKEFRDLYEIIKEINNQYIIEDFNCLFAQINFNDLMAKITSNPNIDLNHPETQAVVSMVQKQDRLGLKKFINKSFPSLQNAAIYDLIKWAFVSSVSAMI